VLWLGWEWGGREGGGERGGGRRRQGEKDNVRRQGILDIRELYKYRV